METAGRIEFEIMVCYLFFRLANFFPRYANCVLLGWRIWSAASARCRNCCSTIESSHIIWFWRNSTRLELSKLSSSSFSLFAMFIFQICSLTHRFRLFESVKAVLATNTEATAAKQAPGKRKGISVFSTKLIDCFPDGFNEFLEAWLTLVEKLLNPSSVMESPYHLFEITGAPTSINFSPAKYLAVTQKASDYSFFRG